MSRLTVVIGLLMTLLITWQVTTIVAENAYTYAVASHNTKPLSVSRRTGQVSPTTQFLHDLNAPKKEKVGLPIIQVGMLIMFFEVFIGVVLLFVLPTPRRFNKRTAVVLKGPWG